MENEKLSNIVAEVLKQVRNEQNKKLTLEIADKLIDAVNEKAKEMGVNAVCAVSNSEGNIIAVKCMDDSYIASYDIAVNKAFTVTALKMSTKTLKPMAQPGQPLYGIQFTNNGKIVIFGGGDPLYHNGKIVGGLGVSGGTEEQDTILSEYGSKIFNNIYK
ncbi:MAG: heme-binding protein [Clostridia bacterium]|nr:heme-binding protein [Clostridia bacterium]MBQ4543684.1 heme-binding protein [Clostridia bacterium]MBQ9997741.1 heme-binding protein [Clostridia bacterium]